MTVNYAWCYSQRYSAQDIVAQFPEATIEEATAYIAGAALRGDFQNQMARAGTGPRTSRKQPGKTFSIEAVKPRATLTKEDLKGVRADLSDVFTGEGEQHRRPQPFPEVDLEPLDLNLVKYLLDFKVSDYSAYLSFPQSKAQDVKDLFERKERILTIGPLAEPKPNTKTARGECAGRGGLGGQIRFRRPKDLTLLEKYPRALEAAQRRDKNGRSLSHVVFQDYVLALQLFFQFNFPLGGPPLPKC